MICAYCRSEYSVEDKDIFKVVQIDIAADIQQLLKKCVEDPENRRRFAGLVLDIDPTNIEARNFLL